jgi:hypothetical protein
MYCEYPVVSRRSANMARMLAGAYVLVLGLSGIAAPQAAARPMVAMHLAPGQFREMTGQPTTVTSTVHYQAEIGLTCDPSYSCRGDFPKPGKTYRLNITRISCVFGSNDLTDQYYYGYAFLYSDSDVALLGEALPVDYGFRGQFSLNRAFDMQIFATQHLHVQLDLLNGPASGGWCTAFGTKDTLG